VKPGIHPSWQQDAEQRHTIDRLDGGPTQQPEAAQANTDTMSVIRVYSKSQVFFRERRAAVIGVKAAGDLRRQHLEKERPELCF
jgi:hypothetical protein